MRGKASTGAGWLSAAHTEILGGQCGSGQNQGERTLKVQPSQRVRQIWTEGMKENEKDEFEFYHEKGMF